MAKMDIKDIYTATFQSMNFIKYFLNLSVRENCLNLHVYLMVIRKVQGNSENCQNRHYHC